MKLLNPLAQTFYVEHSNGMFVTSVDLFFYEKDNNLPVTVQLRPVELGQPSRTVYPFGEVVVDPSDIDITEFGIIPTTVTFPSPVYLEGNKFHSIVISSNSDKYLVWVAEMGQIDTESDNTVVIDKQPLNGGLFKSQNSSSWVEEPFQDLKFTLYRANFNYQNGNINFYNPELSLGNDQIATLPQNSLEMNSKSVRLKLDQEITDIGLKLGTTILQEGVNVSGDYVGFAGTALGQLNIINEGIGYVGGPATFFNQQLVSVTGSGSNALADIEIDSEGVAIAASITSGGNGYVIGDILTVDTLGGSTLGRNLRLSVSNVGNIREIIVDNVQGDFLVSVGNSIKYLDNSGSEVLLNGVGANVLIETDGITTINDGLNVRVNHRNHGMHSPTDRVELSNVNGDVDLVSLSADLPKTSTVEVNVTGTTNYETFENLPVSSGNPGYVKINGEIIQYTGTSTGKLTGITRGIDSTPIENHFADDLVLKYELNGISLRRINKIHTLEDATVQDPIGLDYYTIKIDTANNGIDRTIGTSTPKLYVRESKSCGGSFSNATQNIQYSSVRPVVQTLSLTGTNINPTIRTVSGRSIDGFERSFDDQGFEPINLNQNNYFDSPRALFSKLNEETGLTNLPGNKSINLNLALSSADKYVSPVVDLDRTALILTSNRTNSRIKNYATDNRVSTLNSDPSAFIYATKTISLEVPATSIKLLCSAYVNTFSDLRAFYAIQNDPYEEPIYVPFPGFKNLNNLGQTIDESLSDGTPDRNVPKVDFLTVDSPLNIFKEYEFTENNIESFRYFSIKLIGNSKNQAYPPRIKDLRVIAVA
jgi:hypothetical protein